MSDAMANADSLLAYLEERSQRLRQPTTEKPPAGPAAQENGESPENFSVEKSPNHLTENDNVVFYPFLRSPGEGTYAHVYAQGEPGEPSGNGARPFNSIYITRNNGETEKAPDKPSSSAGLGFSVSAKSGGESPKFPEKPPACCVCKQPIDTLVDTFWGADPAHRPCAEAAFQANKAAGRYKP